MQPAVADDALPIPVDARRRTGPDSGAACHRGRDHTGALARARGKLALLACQRLDLRPTRIEFLRDVLVVSGELAEVGIGEAEDAHVAVGAADLVTPEADVLHGGHDPGEQRG